MTEDEIRTFWIRVVACGKLGSDGGIRRSEIDRPTRRSRYIDLAVLCPKFVENLTPVHILHRDASKKLEHGVT